MAGAHGCSASVDAGVDGDRAEATSSLFDAGDGDCSGCDGQVDAGQPSIGRYRHCGMTSTARCECTRTGGRDVAAAEGGDDQIETVETNAGGAESGVGISGVDECDPSEISAVFVDGEEPEFGLADDRDVVAGGTGGRDEADENRSGSGYRCGCAASQCAMWEQFGQGQGYRDGAQRWSVHGGREGVGSCDGLIADGGDRRLLARRRGYRCEGYQFGGEVGGCVVAASGDRCHLPAKRVELRGFVEPGQVWDRVGCGHGKDLSPCRWDTPKSTRTFVPLSLSNSVVDAVHQGLTRAEGADFRDYRGCPSRTALRCQANLLLRDEGM